MMEQHSLDQKDSVKAKLQTEKMLVVVPQMH